MLNALVKIISKVLVNRLREVLGELVEGHQLGFLNGGNSLDSIATTQEVIQFSKRNKVPVFMLKLDLETAYSMVECECIVETLLASGFYPIWVSWFKLWLVTSKICKLVNGISRREIACKRGLRGTYQIFTRA